jgi:hypothetical protein
MEGKNLILTEILYASIKNKEFQINSYKKKFIDWEFIYSKARTHKIHTLIYPVIKEIDPSAGPDRSLMSLWNVSAAGCGIQMICDEITLGDIIDAFNTMGIKSIILNGAVISRYYPYPELRTMNDTGIMVKEADIGKATEVLQTMGYIAQGAGKTQYVEFCKTEFRTIKLYTKLIESGLFTQAEKINTVAWQYPAQIRLGLSKADAMSTELQVVYMCINTIEKMKQGNFKLRQFSDLFVIAEKNKAQINWSDVKSMAVEYGVEKFVYTVFEVLSRLFYFRIPEELAFKEEINSKLANRIIKNIFMDKKTGKKPFKQHSANIAYEDPVKYI